MQKTLHCGGCDRGAKRQRETELDFHCCLQRYLLQFQLPVFWMGTAGAGSVSEWPHSDANQAKQEKQEKQSKDERVLRYMRAISVVAVQPDPRPFSPCNYGECARRVLVSVL